MIPFNKRISPEKEFEYIKHRSQEEKLTGINIIQKRSSSLWKRRYE